jgi:hypothetical protein
MNLLLVNNNSDVKFELPLPTGTVTTTTKGQLFHQISERVRLRVDVAYTVKPLSGQQP